VSLEERFKAAQIAVKQLSRTPGPDELLQLYGWYKQATEGDVGGARPGPFDFKGRAKFDAWALRRGESTEVAMQRYVDVAERLCAKYQ
jgi:diazepam-binding inhibitor (GABA receptor modulating acyl-CoA-binding protein)